MGEYISREEAVKKIKSRISTANDAWECGYNTAMGEIMELIKHIPTADVEPVRHGRWICEDLQNGFGNITCSCCVESINVSPYRYENLKEYEKFCSNCGAKMDGDAK